MLVGNRMEPTTAAACVLIHDELECVVQSHCMNERDQYNKIDNMHVSYRRTFVTK